MTKNRIKKIILLGIFIFLMIFVLKGVWSMDFDNLLYFESKKDSIKLKDSVFINKNTWIENTGTYHTKNNFLATNYYINGKYSLTVLKFNNCELNLKKGILFDEIRKGTGVSSSMNDDLYEVAHNYSYKPQKNLKKCFFLKEDKTVIEKIIISDTIVNYYFKFHKFGFSINDISNQMLSVEAKGFNKTPAIDLMFYKKNKTLYLMFLTAKINEKDVKKGDLYRLIFQE